MNNSPFPSGSRLAAYLRDSGGEDQELSIEQQEKVVADWAQDNGYILTQIFKDTSSGSSTAGRVGFQEMMTHFRNEADEAGIVVWKFNRFARSLDDAQFYRADLRRRGYEVHSLNDNLPPGLDGRFFEAAIDWMNEKFLADLSIDIKRGQRHLILTYGGVPGRPPLGFMPEPIRIGIRRDGSEHVVHRWVVDPDMIHLIRKAFEMRAAGRSYRQIHDETHLYDNKSGYMRMFRNKIFVGELIFGETIIPDYCDPVIKKDTWDAVQAMHKTRNVYSESLHPRRINSNFILSGIIFCGLCRSIMNGHVITDKTGRRYTYYRCKDRDQRWECKARHIPQEALENAVLDEMKQHILTPDNLAAIQDEEHQVWQENRGMREKERARLQRQLTTVTRKMTNLINVIGDTGNRTLLEKLQELELREMDLQSQLDRLGEHPDPVQVLDIEELSTYITKGLEIGNTGINDLLRNLIHRIEVKRKGKYIRGTIYYYSPIDANRVAGRSQETYKHKLRVNLSQGR